ncbi:hypothetical protein C8R47DRAFT_1207620 [Mycena vitilis]|nr:hypothetical protein C8R47DRAFT_1207620 [Mycena vitilis]
MRISAALFVLSAAGVVFARCAVCPDKVKEGKVVYHLAFGDYNTDLKQEYCGYEEEGQDKVKNQGYCTYNVSLEHLQLDRVVVLTIVSLRQANGTLEGSDMPCPSEAATKEC